MTDHLTRDSHRPAALWAQSDGVRLCDLTHSAGREIDAPIPVGDATELTAEQAARLWAIAVLERYIERRADPEVEDLPAKPPATRTRRTRKAKKAST